ncbi:transaldolase family protein [Pseudobacteriovorax antillogorgiicola]|uniref:Transaldolase n=1 Tax=Pseudobacteriovorax antillogorgiicola TaxID=1513793 RepID=A0A1Y6BT59_9BACT|nr:transaldolase family protein [Pseudobacteriovorax antillogorgiicola]TCS53942.1 transaldolase [Pseudobacteriovorax antillogorgiicola]SMF20248.1 transaldolase [Pseudobacteriovorax antillogorgiicola]
MSALESLVKSGTKLWLDSIDPDLVLSNKEKGATGATSNPIIVSDIIKTGRYDDEIRRLKGEGRDAHDVAWTLTNQLVSQAEEVFMPVFEATQGNDGYVSFEVDPLLEDLELAPPHDERVQKYVSLAKQWAKGHPNRLIKVPATPAGIGSLEDMVAAGVNVNVTLIFSEDQYKDARDAVWRGAQKRDSLVNFKSVFSIFVSRLDVYTDKKVTELSADAQGMAGILNAKRVWKMNQEFWADKKTPLQQEMIFASTGTKKPEDPKWKYVAAFAGSDIETNPPATNDAVEASGKTFVREIDKFPSDAVVQEIDSKVDWKDLEKTLMDEGLSKFAEPQKALLKLIESI